MSAAPYPTILCVEDESCLLELRKLQLERAGYRVFTAASPGEALCLFATQDVDLVLTDYLLPGMNGIALGRQMKRTRPDLIVMLVSGWPDCFADPTIIDRVLPKPMDMQELVCAITAMLPPARRYGT